MRLLRFHGSRDKVDFELVGYNSRLDELQAAALRLFLPSLSTAGTRPAARRPRATPSSVSARSASCPPTTAGHVYHMYVVRTPERDRIAAALTAAEISCASYYVTPLHLQPALRFLGWEPGSLPETERAARENLALPMWAGIDAEHAGADRRRSMREALASERGVISLPITRHRFWQLVVDGCARRRRVVPRLPPPLRPEDPAVLPHDVHADDLDRRR